MKFKVNVEKLCKAIGPVFDIATRNADKNFDFYSQMTISANKDKLEASSYGGTACIIANISDKYVSDINYNCEEEGRITVDAEEFLNNLMSFCPKDNVIISFNDSDISISLENDPDQIQTVAPLQTFVIPPKLATKFQKTIKVNREVLVDGMKKVKFAIGFEESKPYYHCLVIDGSKKGATFSSGTGGMFAIYNVDGNAIVETDVNTTIRFVIPKANIENIIKILSESSADSIVIQESTGEGCPDQIHLDFSGTKIILLGLDANNNFQDLTKILDKTYPFHFGSKIEDWTYVVDGASAVYTYQEKQESAIHMVRVSWRDGNDYLLEEAETKTKSKRKIPVSRIKAEISSGSTSSFSCAHPYLRHIVKSSDNTNDEIVIKFDGSSGDKGKKSPVRVDWLEKVNQLKDTKENFTLFFAQVNV